MEAALEKGISEGILYFLKFPLLGLICAFVVVSLRIIYQGMPQAEIKRNGKQNEQANSNLGEQQAEPGNQSRKSRSSISSGVIATANGKKASETVFDLSYAPTAVDMPAVGSEYAESLSALKKSAAAASAVSGSHLIVDSPYLKEKIMPVNQTLVFGRAAECNVKLTGNFVSSRHAQLSVDSSGVVLEDLGSSNGTFCNGELLTTPVYLKDGDEFSIDDSKFVYKQG